MLSARLVAARRGRRWRRRVTAGAWAPGGDQPGSRVPHGRSSAPSRSECAPSKDAREKRADLRVPVPGPRAGQGLLVSGCREDPLAQRGHRMRGAGLSGYLPPPLRCGAVAGGASACRHPLPLLPLGANRCCKPGSETQLRRMRGAQTLGRGQGAQLAWQRSSSLRVALHAAADVVAGGGARLAGVGPQALPRPAAVQAKGQHVRQGDGGHGAGWRTGDRGGGGGDSAQGVMAG